MFSSIKIARPHFYVMHQAPAEPCFFLTKRGFINAILCTIAIKDRWLGAQRREGSAALVLGSILVATSLVIWL